MAGMHLDTLALYDADSAGPSSLADAATDRGLAVLPLSTDPEADAVAPRTGLAWRCPTGYAELQQVAGRALPLTAAPGAWLVGLPEDVLGRRLSVRTAGELAAGGDPGLPRVASVKLANHKRRSLPMQRVDDVQGVRTWAARLPADYQLLLANDWLRFHSEYRIFTVGRSAVAWSPYVIEDEVYSPALRHHRASFHDEAAAFAEGVLGALPDRLVPPAIVMDIARLDSDGRLVLLETNTSWGAGLYGCDPQAVLDAVLVANQPADPYWSWTP